MTGMKMLDAVGYLDDTLILQAETVKKRKPWKAITAIAACLCLLFAGYLGVRFMLTTPQDPIKPQIELKINDTKNARMRMHWLDIDAVRYDDGTEEQLAEGIALFEEKTGLSYGEFTKNMPRDENFIYCVYFYFPFDENGERMRDENGERVKEPHDFIFCYTREDVYDISVAVSPVRPPLRCVVYPDDRFEKSMINGTECVILAEYGNGGNGSYYIDFEKDGLFYYIGFDDATEETLVDILCEYIN